MLKGSVVSIDESFAKIERKGGFLGIKRVSHPKGVLVTGVLEIHQRQKPSSGLVILILTLTGKK